MFEHNKICDLLNIRFPIIQGGMAWSTDSKLACAVSDAGGLGIIGCGGRESDWVLGEIYKSKEFTRSRIGLNVALGDSNALNIVKIAIDNGIGVFTMGGANIYLELLKMYGDEVLIIPLVGSVMEAKLAERAGAKAIICEGQESGGSIGRQSLFSLLPQVCDSVKIPVIAAGGIGDRRGMNAAFELGAQGVQMGTRFLASFESPVSEDYKNRIVKARDTDSMVIFNKINYPARVIKNKFSVDYINKEKNGADYEELMSLSKGRLRAAVESDIDSGAIMAGEISGMIREIKGVREIINDMVSDSLNSRSKNITEITSDQKLIGQYLRHLPPILLVDKILKLEPGIECSTSLKLNHKNWFFRCHYPDYPVMPGSLLIEAMSQTFTMVITSMKEFTTEWGGILLLSSVSNAKFKKEALPGMDLVFSAKINSFKRGIVKGNIICESNNDLICLCEMTIVIPNSIKRHSNQSILNN